MIVDLSPVSFVDATAVQRFEELRDTLAARGIKLGTARARRQLGSVFEADWLAERRVAATSSTFPTLRAALEAFAQAGAAAARTLDQPGGGDQTDPVVGPRA